MEVAQCDDDATSVVYGFPTIFSTLVLYVSKLYELQIGHRAVVRTAMKSPLHDHVANALAPRTGLWFISYHRKGK
jgi:hypothetical protein